MVDDADLIESCELKIWGIIQKMRKAGMRYEIVHDIFSEILKTLELQSYIESWLNQYNKEP